MESINPSGGDQLWKSRSAEILGGVCIIGGINLRIKDSIDPTRGIEF